MWQLSQNEFLFAVVLLAVFPFSSKKDFIHIPVAISNIFAEGNFDVSNTEKPGTDCKVAHLKHSKRNKNNLAINIFVQMTFFFLSFLQRYHIMDHHMVRRTTIHKLGLTGTSITWWVLRKGHTFTSHSRKYV